MVLFELLLLGGATFVWGSKEIPKLARIGGRISGKSIKMMMELKNDLSGQDSDVLKVIIHFVKILDEK